MINILIVFTKLIIILLILFLLSIKNKNEKELSNSIINNSNIELYNKGEYLNLIEIKYAFSFAFNLVTIEYKFGFYENNNLILPSDLALYKNLRLICYIEILNNQRLTINSLPNIYRNSYYKCIEYCKMNEKINFGITFYKKTENRSLIQKNFIFLTKKYLIIKIAFAKMTIYLIIIL